jgi:hypothetical protein
MGQHIIRGGAISPNLAWFADATEKNLFASFSSKRNALALI